MRLRLPGAARTPAGPGAVAAAGSQALVADAGGNDLLVVEPGTRHAACGTSPACRVVASGFTSIVDLSFAPEGSLYVVEIDEASWAAVDFGLPSAGGTVNRCDVARGTCAEVASHLQMPTAVAVTRDGVAYAAIRSLIPGAAQVVALTA